MLTFNEKLKEITIWEILLVSIPLLLIFSLLDISIELSFGLVILYILIRTRHQFGSLKHDLTHAYSKIPFKTVLLIFITNLILAFGIGYLTNYISGSYSVLKSVPATEGTLISGLTVGFILNYFIGNVVIGPLAEELMFRGVLLSRLNRKLPVIISILISSIIFGILHQFSGFISATIFGICMSFIYLKTDNIFTSTTVHILNNFSIMLLFFIPNIDEFIAGDIPTIIISILSIISFIWIVNFLRTTWSEIKE